MKLLRDVNKISSHINTVTKGERNVQRMILYFEVDDMMRIYLTKVTELITREDKILKSKIIPETLLPVFGKPSSKNYNFTSRDKFKYSAQKETKEV